MTHGEDLVSEMHQDSIVLTYLEGLLMHQTAGGSGSVVDKKPTSNAEDQNFSISGNASPSCQRDGVPNTHTYRSSGMLHHKKARLLQSSEDWNAENKGQLSDSFVDINEKKEVLLAGMVENVPKSKQDSTLLASLLQSFSSRLQSVALSQQIRQSLKEQGYSLSNDSLQVEKDLRCYGVASSHLKTLLKKNKLKDEKLETGLPELTTNLVQDRFKESTHSGQSGSKAMNESLSCAARLQAVANMVEKRSSPAASPKPSVACSQLALLLSSEAHLQQYSREHALKAQNANQIASERLSVMAKLKETVPSKDVGRFKLSKGMESHLNGQARCSNKTTTNKSNTTNFQSHMGIIYSSPKITNYKTSEKSHMKPPTNSSLLLHLLKNHSTTKQNKQYEQNGRSSIFEESSTPTTVDEYSDNNPSFTEDDSSDDGSSHSNCLPIDLSFKQKTNTQDSGQTTSLDNLTQSLFHSWESKVPCLENIEEKDTSKNTKLNPDQKVTLLQLLLGHKEEENSPKVKETEGTLVPADVAKFNFSMTNRTPITDSSNTNRIIPVHTPPLQTSAKADSPINLSHNSPFMIKCNSPPYTCIIHPERLSNPASKHLIDLTIHKELHGSKQNKKETLQTPSSFSASKLLQNLAQCGMQSSMSGDNQRQASKQLMTLNTEKPVGLTDGLNTSLLHNTSCTLEKNRILTNQFLPEQKLPNSEIQNLLERRTVLQLLLGTTNKNMNETKEKMFLKEESLQDSTEKVLNEQILTVKIKSEPSEEESSALQNSNAQQIIENVNKKFPETTHSLERNIAISPASEEFQSQSLTSQDYSFSKNGLLSRLLRQSQDGCSADNLDRRNHEQSFVESKSHSMLPKKRKLHSDSLEGPLKILKSNKGKISDVTINHKTTADALYGSCLNQKESKFIKTDFEIKYSSGYVSNNESENRSWSTESKGFNVLKQLLLSENCEKDMSQHRNNLSVMNGKKKGSKHNLTNNDKAEFSVSPMHTLIGNPGQPSNCLDYQTFQYSVAMKSPASSPFTEYLGGTISSKPECDQFSICHVPNERGPLKWVITDSDKNDLERDSPRLTQTNPILYYMLQKGGNPISVQEAHSKDAWRDKSFMENSSSVTMKKELSPVTECKTFPNRRNAYISHSNNMSIQHNGEVYGLLENVLTIKKEPE